MPWSGHGIIGKLRFAMGSRWAANTIVRTVRHGPVAAEEISASMSGLSGRGEGGRIHIVELMGWTALLRSGWEPERTDRETCDDCVVGEDADELRTAGATIPGLSDSPRIGTRTPGLGRFWPRQPRKYLFTIRLEREGIFGAVQP